MSTDTYKPRSKPSPRSSLAKDLKGFGPTGLFALGAILLTGTIIIGHIAIPLGASLVLLWRKLSQTPWQQIGYVQPKSWTKIILTGVLFGFIFKLFTKAVVMPLLGAGPRNLAYHYLSGNSALLPFAAWGMLVAGFAEETVFRGFLFERLSKFFGAHWWTKPVTVLLTSLWFGLGHIQNQGTMGALHATLFGLVIGTLYAKRYNLFFLMISHAMYDMTALVLIYWNLETAVAKFFFH